MLDSFILKEPSNGADINYQTGRRKKSHIGNERVEIYQPEDMSFIPKKNFLGAAYAVAPIPYFVMMRALFWGEYLTREVFLFFLGSESFFKDGGGIFEDVKMRGRKKKAYYTFVTPLYLRPEW